MSKILGFAAMLVMGCSTAMEDAATGALSDVSYSFSDGIPTPPSTWTMDPDTGWGNLVGAVDFPVRTPVGSTLPEVLSFITDNANSCSLCADGDTVAMMYVSTHDNSFTVLSEVLSLSDGVERLYGIATDHVVQPGETITIRFNTLFTFQPANPRTSLIQPPHS
jgi:hypothetical protein